MKLCFNRSDLLDAGWDLEDISESTVFGEMPDPKHSTPYLAVFNVVGSHLIYGAPEDVPQATLEAMLRPFNDTPRVVA